MGAKAQRLSKKELVRNKGAKQRDPLQDLRRSVERRQSLGAQARADNRGLVGYLINNVNWSQLLPVVIPLVLSVLRGRQSATPQATQHTPGQALGSTGSQAGAAQPSLGLIGLLGSLLGGASASPAQAQPQGDALGGLLQTLSGAQGTQARPQADALTGLLQTLSGVQGTQPRPQAGALTGLLQALSGSRTTQFEQDRAPAERGPTAGAQTGSVLRLLGTTPQSQRTAEVKPLFDVLANNMDLDGDGVPDALEQMLGSQVDDDTEKNGAAALLQGLLDNAGAQDLAAFSRSVQELLPPA